MSQLMKFGQLLYRQATNAQAACLNAQTHQSFRCSHIKSMDEDHARIQKVLSEGIELKKNVSS